jgi:hypothetical protein
MESNSEYVSRSQIPVVDFVYKKASEFATRYQTWLVIKFAQEYMQANFLKGNDINIPKLGTFSPRTIIHTWTSRMVFFKPDFHFYHLLKHRNTKNF